MIYGLPLTSDMENLEQKILETLKPFVKKVLEIAPCKHKTEKTEDFFAGHYDGNWRLKVYPKEISKFQTLSWLDGTVRLWGRLYTREK